MFLNILGLKITFVKHISIYLSKTQDIFLTHSFDTLTQLCPFFSKYSNIKIISSENEFIKTVFQSFGTLIANSFILKANWQMCQKYFISNGSNKFPKGISMEMEMYFNYHINVTYQKSFSFKWCISI